jgi:signal transduction histidine kinase
VNAPDPPPTSRLFERLRARLYEVERLDADPQRALGGTGRLVFVMAVPWLATPLLLWYALRTVLNNPDAPWLALFHGFAALAFGASGVAVQLRPDERVVTWCARASLASLLILLLGAFVFLRGQFTLLWAGVLPMTAIFVLGLREGIFWSVATLFAWLYLLGQEASLGAWGGNVSWPGPDERSDFVVALLAITAISAGYEVLRDRTRQRLLEQADALLQTSRLESIGRLTSGVAHDFNNLLTVVIGQLDLLALEAERSGLDVDGLERARTASTRAADLTGKLLSFARRQPLRPESVDLEVLFRDSAQLFESSLGETVTIATGVADAPLACRADRHQLENALLNLAMNARDAMPTGGALTIVAQRFRVLPNADSTLDAGAYVRISVSDVGPGIPAAVRERVFEPFFTTKELGAGTGLGLSMVQGFCRQSGGDARLREPRGGRAEDRTGTTVELYLPETDPPAAAGDLTGGSRSSW